MRGGGGAYEEGTHTSEKEPFGNRAFFRVESDPAFLLISEVRTEVSQGLKQTNKKNRRTTCAFYDFAAGKKRNFFYLKK